MVEFSSSLFIGHSTIHMLLSSICRLAAAMLLAGRCYAAAMLLVGCYAAAMLLSGCCYAAGVVLLCCCYAAAMLLPLCCCRRAQYYLFYWFWLAL